MDIVCGDHPKMNDDFRLGLSGWNSVPPVKSAINLIWEIMFLKQKKDDISSRVSFKDLN